MGMGIVLASFLSSFSESVGVGLIIPLLSLDQAPTFLEGISFLDPFLTWVESMTIVERVRVVALVLFSAILFRSIFMYISKLLSYKIRIDVDCSLRRQVFDEILRLDQCYIDKSKMGNLFSVLSDFPRSTGQMMQQLTSAFVHIFTIIVYTVMMLWLSWQLTIIAVVLMIFVSLIARLPLKKKIRALSESVKELTSQLNSFGIEKLSGMKLIHLFSQEGSTRQEHHESTALYQQKMTDQSRYTTMMTPLVGLISAVVLGGVLVASTLIFSNAGPSLVVLISLFIAIMYRLISPIARLNETRALIMSLYPTFDEIWNFLNRPERTSITSGQETLSGIATGIELKNISFRYGQHETQVLSDVSFTIPAGKKTAIVGPSGAGKTTIANLIARLYESQQGEIIVDGLTLDELELSNWRSHIGVVSQDPFVFNESVIENLRFAKPDATREEIEEAARLAVADRFINELPEGYDTLLGDRGVRLSGGQLQRIAIARAILASPSILILDEATSHLDSVTEQSIQRSLSTFSKGRTVLSIAHRLSTVQDADNIIMLENGRVVEQGTHDELIKAKKSYYKFSMLQEPRRSSTSNS